jgi:cell wall-associated NlpC family hydrolase
VLTPARALSRARNSVLAILVALLSVLGIVGTAAPAQATTYQSAVLNEALHHRGQPYVYGAAGPTRFDCSGFTQYVFSRFGRRLPHNSAQQWNYVRHIPKASRQPADIIFLRSSSGSIYHVGIYAGNNKMWHAPKRGDVVRLATIWTSNYSVGRI